MSIVKCKKEINTFKELTPLNSFKKNESIKFCEKESKFEKLKYSVKEKNEIIIPKQKSKVRLKKIPNTEINERNQINNLKRKSTEKIAPIFLKKAKFNSLNSFSETLKSEFNPDNKITSTIPSEIKTLPFPTISHVPKLTSFNNIEIKNLFDVKKDIDNYKISEDFTNFCLFKNIQELRNKDETYVLNHYDINLALNEIETQGVDAMVLWEYVSIRSAFTNLNLSTLRSKKKITAGKLRTKENINLNVLCEQWTDKYKPLNKLEIVGNEEAAEKLRSWLKNWKFKKVNEKYNSADEFYASDSSSSTDNESHLVAVLIGPHGCGKTASVYAIAKELNYKVLEVNASSKRCGKKIFKDLEEATKSHRLKEPNNIFSKSIKNNNKCNENEKGNKNSVILIEDIDVIFEEDEGFISACFQLATNSKRPIIFTLQSNCSYLNKVAPDFLQINFQIAKSKRVSTFLQLIALAETGNFYTLDFINALLKNGDLRKALLQLQFLLLSSRDKMSLASLNPEKTFGEITSQVYKTAIKVSKSSENKFQKEYNLENNIMSNLSNNLDVMSFLINLSFGVDPYSQIQVTRKEQNVSLEEDISLYLNVKNIGLEIKELLEDLLNRTDLIKMKKHSKIKNTYNDGMMTKKKINHHISKTLSDIPSFTLDKRAISVDYLSSIRTICRSENNRNQTNCKRGNRFFHYFQGAGSFQRINSKNILFAACNILSEELKNDYKN